MQAKPMYTVKAKDITNEVARLERIAEKAKEIYLAGHWRCPELSEGEQEELWLDLRELFGDISYTRDVLGGAKE